MPCCTLVVAAAAVAVASAAASAVAVGGNTAAPAAFPVPTALPPRGWDDVGHQVFIHGCKRDGLFNDSELALAARFPLMTVEKGQGLELPGFADGKMAAIAAQWKAARAAKGEPDGWALFYINAKLDWPFFQIHSQMEAHPGWPVQRGGGSGGDPCLAHGDPTFPQPPEGMLCFNHSLPSVRAAFVDACVNATHHGFDGCFIDSAGYARPPPYPESTPAAQAKYAASCNTSVPAVDAVGHGTTAVLAELQHAVGPGRLVVAKDTFGGGSEEQVNAIFPLDTFCSCYSCDWTPTNDPPFRSTTYSGMCQTQIEEAVRLGARGQAVLLHGEVNAKLAARGDPAALETDFEFSLAAYLVAASNTSFFGYSDGWFFNGSTWHAQYDRPLGAPLGPAQRGAGGSLNTSWTRAFASGTTVSVHVHNHTATIDWAATTIGDSVVDDADAQDTAAGL